MVILLKSDALVAYQSQTEDLVLSQNYSVAAWGRTRDARKPTPRTWINTAVRGHWRHTFTEH